MGHIIALVDKGLVSSFKSFEKKYGSLEGGSNDYQISTPRLQGLFLELKDIIHPLNGEFAMADNMVDTGKYLDAEYVFGKDVVWMELAYSDVQNVIGEVAAIARKHKVALYDIDGKRVFLSNGLIVNKKTDGVRDWGVVLAVAFVMLLTLLVNL